MMVELSEEDVRLLMEALQMLVEDRELCIAGGGDDDGACLRRECISADDLRARLRDALVEQVARG